MVTIVFISQPLFAFNKYATHDLSMHYAPKDEGTYTKLIIKPFPDSNSKLVPINKGKYSKKFNSDLSSYKLHSMQIELKTFLRLKE